MLLQHQMFLVLQDLGTSLVKIDGFSDTGSHGPGSSDDNRNTRRRLDTHSSTEDEQPRSSVKGITKWIDNILEESNMPVCNTLVRVHCKGGSVSVMLVFETRAKCQDFVARYEDDGIDNAINRPFSCANTNNMFRQSKSIGDLEIGRHLRLLRIELADHLK